MTDLPLQAQKMVDLSRALAKKGVTAVTHNHGTPEWFAWLGWRKKQGLSVTFMESRNRYGFPCDMPPDCGLDTALAEAQAGTASKKLAT